MKWKAEISEVGREVPELLESTHMFDLVSEGRREDMRDFTVHFTGGLPKEPIKAGDTLVIGNTELFVIALGDDFNEHLRDHAACTVELSTGMVAHSPGGIVLEGVYEGYEFLKKGASLIVK